MQKESRLLDDLARMANGALSSFTSLKGEAENRMRQQIERVLANMDLVMRDEFEAVKEMAAKARAENADLAARLDALEGKPGAATSRTKAAGAARRRGSGGTAAPATAAATAAAASKSTKTKRSGGEGETAGTEEG